MTSYCIWVVSPRGYSHSRGFDEIAESLQYAFDKLGYDVAVHKDPVAPEVDNDCRIVVIGAHLLRGAAFFKNWIIYNLEQIYNGSSWLTDEYRGILEKNQVWDYSQANIDELKKLGINGDAKLLELGYTPVLTKIENSPEKDIDVLFYGCLNSRRNEIINTLTRKGMKVKWLFNQYGVTRDAYIARAKIVLNIHFYESKVFEIVRCLYALANQKCIISEIGRDEGLEKPFYPAMEFCAYGDMVASVTKYIADPSLITDAENRGFEYIKTRDQVEYLRRVL